VTTAWWTRLLFKFAAVSTIVLCCCFVNKKHQQQKREARLGNARLGTKTAACMFEGKFPQLVRRNSVVREVRARFEKLSAGSLTTVLTRQCLAVVDIQLTTQIFDWCASFTNQASRACDKAAVGKDARQSAISDAKLTLSMIAFENENVCTFKVGVRHLCV